MIKNNKKTILSGITTSGILHLGNYLGAIKNWVKLQDESETYLFAASMHAITTDQNPTTLKNNIYNAIITYLACGIDHNKATLFVQSQNHHHAELSWILSCNARIGWLNRMTQFKEKSGKNKENSYVGLYTYPILMAADILLYNPDLVPVGDDQKQHLELTRDIASAFNAKYGETFIIPEPLITGYATRVMSLRDATKKMSKSDESDYSRINLDDDEDAIKRKIQKAKSDSEVISSDNIDNRGELKNMINIYAACTNNEPTDILNKFIGKGFSELKKELTEIIIEIIRPISNNIKNLRNNLDYIDSIINCGNIKAMERSEITFKNVKEKIGLL